MKDITVIVLYIQCIPLNTQDICMFITGEFIVGRVIKAMNNSWHPDCFLCEICTAPLADEGFVKNAGRWVGCCEGLFCKWLPIQTRGGGGFFYLGPNLSKMVKFNSFLPLSNYLWIGYKISSLLWLISWKKDVEYIHVGHEHFLSSMKSLGWRLCGINLILKKITEEKLKFTKPSP